MARAAGRGALALELYAGCGFFTLALARAFERVIAVEADAAAVADLRHNLARAGARERRGRARARVEAALAGGRSPRSGPTRSCSTRRARASRAAPPAALCALAPERIAYLSCDPATLARDLAALVAGGFALEAVEAFDLFPQTPHVEALAILAGDSNGGMQPFGSRR